MTKSKAGGLDGLGAISGGRYKETKRKTEMNKEPKDVHRVARQPRAKGQQDKQAGKGGAEIFILDVDVGRAHSWVSNPSPLFSHFPFAILFPSLFLPLPLFSSLLI